MPTQYPNRLHELRLRSRLTQAEVAMLLGVSMSSVAKHETGARSPSREEIIRYAHLYKVQTYELFTSVLDPQQPSEGGYIAPPYHGRLAVVDPATIAAIEAEDALNAAQDPELAHA